MNDPFVIFAVALMLAGLVFGVTKGRDGVIIDEPPKGQAFAQTGVILFLIVFAVLSVLAVLFLEVVK